MPEAFIQQFTSLPASNIRSGATHLTGTKTMTFTREDGDLDNHHEWLEGNVVDEPRLSLGTMTSTANPLEGPEQEQSTDFLS